MVLIWRIDLWIQAFQSCTPADTNTTLFNLPAVTFCDWVRLLPGAALFFLFVSWCGNPVSCCCTQKSSKDGKTQSLCTCLMYCNVITIWPSVKCLGFFFFLRADEFQHVACFNFRTATAWMLFKSNRSWLPHTIYRIHQHPDTDHVRTAATTFWVNNLMRFVPLLKY